MRPLERLSCKYICVSNDPSNNDNDGMPTIQLVMIPVQVKCISGNTLVSVTGITLVIDRLAVLISFSEKNL